MPKKLYVTDLKPGMQISEVFYATSWTTAKTRAGKDYIRTRLSDRSGSIECVCWEASKDDIINSKDKHYVDVTGSVSKYQDNLQITAISIYDAGIPEDPADFLPVSPLNPQDMLNQLNAIVQSISSEPLRNLVNSVLDDPRIAEKLATAPAAKSYHHAYAGGLLEHTLGVTGNCDLLSGRYPDVDRNLLIAGAVLHDIGKIIEMGWSGAAVEYSDEGTLVGHLYLGASLVREKAGQIDGLDHFVLLSIEHMILSHHGEFEYGSPILPKSREAMLLHYADNIDAKLFQMTKAIQEADDQDESGMFTSYIKGLDRPVFRGITDSNDKLNNVNNDSEYDPFEEE